MTPTQESRIDGAVLELGRKALQGVATRTGEVGEERVRTISGKEVWKKLGGVPTHVERRLRRLKEYKKWMRDPGHHRQVIASVFGKLPLETYHAHNPCTIPDLSKPTPGTSASSSSGLAMDTARPPGIP